MCDFIIKGQDSDRFPEMLLSLVPGFAASVEFLELDPDLARLPGLVCAAFGCYLVRLQQEATKHLLAEPDKASLDASYKAIETLAARNDPGIANILQVEFFENLDPDLSIFETIKARLGPVSRSLYQEWNERNE